MLKKAWQDPGLWFLLILNSYFVYYYLEHPDGFHTIVWVFFVQSLLIGVFNFFTLLSIKDPDPKSLSLNQTPISKNSMGCAAFFFLFHYGFFHFVYFIFLLVDFRKGINFEFVLISAGLFILESTIHFMRSKRSLSQSKTNVGLLFFIPYLRIIPMHLMILLPSFIGIRSSVIFIILKTGADVGMYLLTRYKSLQPQSSTV